MENFDDCILGETTEEITLETSDENREAAIKMINGCRHHLNIISRDLDPCIYDTRELTDAIKKLALRSRSSRIRIIILQTESLKTRGHRLLDLSERLSSFIEIKKPAKQHSEYNRSLMLVDNCGYIRRPHADRFEGKASFHDRKSVAELQEEFKILWENGEYDPNFRRLSL